MKRRELIIGLGLSLLTPWVTRSAHADEGKAEESAEYLFVQNAKGVSLSNGILRLIDYNPATTFFSDRPERIVGHEPTEDFIAEWGDGENSFAKNPPNAALSILTGPEPQEVILELMNPRIEKNDLLYDVKVLEGKSAVSGEVVSLFIDPIVRRVVVHHRRRRRRVVRRH
ncbi:MAG: hypothetical protein WBF77_02540 [Sulfurimonadaceae bacterium]